MSGIKDTLNFFKIMFKLDLKHNIAYPGAFWIIVFTIPFYSAIQIIFLDTIFLQTDNFLGYTKYQGYILIGTYRIVQSIAYLLFSSRLQDFRGLLRGNNQETFDMALIKPVNTMLYTTLGKFNFGNIAPLIVGVCILRYGLVHLESVELFNLAGYLVFVLLGAILVYIVFFLMQMLLFWFSELQVIESLWETYQDLGQYPTKLYTGGSGILLNILIPITLMGAIPTDYLLGRISSVMLLVYTAIILTLFLFANWFWSISIKKYSSFSS